MRRVVRSLRVAAVGACVVLAVACVGDGQAPASTPGAPAVGDEDAGGRVADGAVDEDPTAESPAAESPAAESPAAESPAAESPAAESLAAEGLAAESLAVGGPVTEDPSAGDVTGVGASPSDDAVESGDVDVRDAAPPLPMLSSEPAAEAFGLLDVPFTSAELTEALRMSPLPPVPPDPTNRWADDPRAAHLGRWLFFDERLSRDGSMSCATCHVPEFGFHDGLARGAGRVTLDRHTQNLWNVGHQRWLFWDGRRDSLWAQALVPIEHPREMAHDRTAIAHLVAADAALSIAYEQVFGALPDLSDRRRFPPHARPIPDDEDHDHSVPDIGEHEHDDHPHQRAWDAMTEDDRAAVDRVFANLGKALAAYQRLLVADDAPFDTFVEGLREGDAAKIDALSTDAQLGLKRFLGPARCALCHSGPTFSDLEFHNVLVPPALDLEEDLGRYGGVLSLRRDPFRGTGAHSDAPDTDEARKSEWLVDASGRPSHDVQAQFRTPGLRNVTRTAPYMHQGQLADLEAVLEHYSTHAGAPRVRGHIERFFEPLHLDAAARAQLIAFLTSLEDRAFDDALLSPPESPVPP